MQVYKSTTGQAGAAPTNGPAPKVVGPNIMGTKEEYQLVRRLQSALFGGVYEAKGLMTNKHFAIKVLHKSELSKAQKVMNSIDFCEVPLSEIRFAELMKGNDHVMEAEDNFEDAYCFYIVFELARGGDLLEALKQKPNGFDEAHAQFLIKQAAKGLAFLHQRRLAMQDVSLENMLMHVRESDHQFQIKVCDPGQAVVFEIDAATGEELPVKFRGLVGKSFRPPELHAQESYYATKVDAWCLGWSTFYLLTAQPLFMSADPVQQDPDWALFKSGDYAKVFQHKQCSLPGLDFILRLMQLDPKKRMSVADALNHAWLSDPRVPPMFAPKELLDEPTKKTKQTSEVESDAKRAQQDGAARISPAAPLEPTSPQPPSLNGTSSPGGQLAGRSGYVAAAARPIHVRSPVRSPRSGPTLQQGVVSVSQEPDRQGAQQAAYQKMSHTRSSSSSISSWVQTASGAMARTASPDPTNAATSPPHGLPSATAVRGISPFSAATSPLLRRAPTSQSTFYTPRSTQPQNVTSNTNSKSEASENQSNDGIGARGRIWAFRSEAPSLGGSQKSTDIQAAIGGESRHHARTLSPAPVGTVPWSSGVSTVLPPSANARAAAQSPQPRTQQTQYYSSAAQRSLSPTQPQGTQVSRLQPFSNSGNSQVRDSAVIPSFRTHSPRTGSPISPRLPLNPAVVRGASPGPSSVSSRPGFAWSPDPPSPPAPARSFSPGPMPFMMNGRSNGGMRWMG